ncbi:NUDIX hydrolase [Lysinibacillus sp. NPDC097195]|uniref:NUDIX hydrolase n=1 Tax=Lysinibacillus sp. NPDC097195 TaxID=3364141 RepID=UPI0038032655
MDQWFGSSGICINEQNELLMVLQGKPEEEKTWTVPSGGLEPNETYEACCLREFQEETGFIVEIVDEIKKKQGKVSTYNIAIEVQYFLVKIIGGERTIQDPDNLIYDIAWKTLEDLKTMHLSFPEDRAFLMHYMENRT